MVQFGHALASALQQGNYYSALFMAAAIPDICGKLENPNWNVGRRYKQWCEDYLYIDRPGEKDSVSPSDYYAFRCALLHEGTTDVARQRAADLVSRFEFTIPTDKKFAHMNLLDNRRQLQVDIHCNNILNGMGRWFDKMQKRPDVMRRMNDLMFLEQFPFFR